MHKQYKSYIGKALVGGHTSLLAVSLSSLLAVFIFLTLSIEVTFTLKVAGFDVRPVYFFMGGFIVLNIRYIYYGVRVMLASLFAFICVVISVLQGISPTLSIAHAMLATFSISFGLSSVGYLYKSESKVLSWWIDLYILSGLLVSVYSIIEFVIYIMYPSLATWWIGPIPRVSALTFEPSYLAFFLVPIFFVAFTMRRYRTAALIFISVLLSTSRTGLVGLVGGTGALFLIGGGYFRQLFRATAKYAAVVSVILLVLPNFQTALVQFYKFILSGFTLSELGSSAQARLLSWYYAAQLFIENPFFGVGIMGYGPALHAKGILTNVPAMELRTTNLYLEILAELGGLGFIAFIWWVFAPIVRLWKNRRLPKVAGFLAALGSMIFMFPFIQTWWRPYLWMAWILAYALVAHYRLQARNRTP